MPKLHLTESELESIMESLDDYVKAAINNFNYPSLEATIDLRNRRGELKEILVYNLTGNDVDHLPED